jgi:hypothetical protein
VAVLVTSIGLSGCAGEIGRVALQIPVPAPFPGPPGSPRLAVRPLHDLRELELLKSREGWFLEYLPDEVLEPAPVQAVTQALVERLRASGRFEQVLSLGPDEGVEEPFSPPRSPVPAELILEGELQTFYVERSTVTNPLLSMMVAPLGLPLAALSGLRLLPTPITPFLPVTYHANLTIQVRLRDSRTEAVIWERTVEGISELSETAATDFFKGKDALMREAASRALHTGIEKLARQVPSLDWFMARWPKHRSSGPVRPTAAPR